MTDYEVYHIGFLCNDRKKDEQLDAIATSHLADCEAGKCFLFQKKIREHEYEYRRLDIPKRYP